MSKRQLPKHFFVFIDEENTQEPKQVYFYWLKTWTAEQDIQ